MIFGGCADKLILIPTITDAKPLGPTRLMLPHNTGQLEIWINPNRFQPDTQAYLLTFNGNADRADNMVMIESHNWSDLPIEVWAMNYPGYGLSTGPAKLNALAPAALAAFDELQKRAGGKPIFVSGMSLGTAVALHVAAHRPVAGIFLWNPPPLRQLILGRFGWWTLWLLAGPVALGVPSDLDSLANASQATAPAVFLMSEYDEIVPRPYQQRVFDAYAGPKQSMTLAAGHNDALSRQDDQTLRQHLDWLFQQATRITIGLTDHWGPANPAFVIRYSPLIRYSGFGFGNFSTPPCISHPAWSIICSW